MKKLFIACFLFPVSCIVCSCSNLVKNHNGSEKLVELRRVSEDCVFLYKLEAEVSVYDEGDAKRFLENKIMDQVRPGNSYEIVSIRTRPNEWAVFGPDRAFITTANVYNCPKN